MPANSHTVLRVPPYHPDLNPIELNLGGRETVGWKKNTKEK
jgi:transposase